MAKKVKKKIKNIQFEGSEKISLTLANGISVILESSEKEIQELSDLGINSINAILQFNEAIKQKQIKNYIG